MKRRAVLIWLTLLCCIRLEAQRPVGDTLLFFDNNGDYLYSTSIYQNSAYNLRYSLMSNSRYNISDELNAYKNLFNLFWNSNSELSWNDFINLYPDLAAPSLGRYTVGQEIDIYEDMVIIGLAVCPEVLSTAEQLSRLNSEPYIRVSTGEWIHAVDTTIAGRLTEYMQLYTINEGTPILRGEGTWRLEDPHRYMIFPKTVGYDMNTVSLIIGHEPYVVPLFEAMFDTGVYIEAYKSSSIIVAGTHNNNGAVWSSVASDAVFSSPRICFEHSPTYYSTTKDTLILTDNGINWIKYDTLPWYRFMFCYPINIFPILDTMFGKPCASVSNLQAVEVDSLCATVMWSADARHHYWEVEYCATGLPPDSARVVTVEVPTVTLTGLAPGTEYSVAVRGQCDIFIDNYSPWGDTLLFTTPQPPQDTTPDTLPWVTPFTLGAHGMGNLDRFTRIMPNPASELVNVLSSFRMESVAVYDLTGRLVLEQPAEGLSATVDVSALPKGVYVVAIRTLQGVATKKLLVE